MVMPMPDSQPILVFGAGGTFARHIAPELIRHGACVRGVVHSDAGEAVARSCGVNDIVRADLHDEASLRAVLAGVERVFYIAPKFLTDEEKTGARLVRLAAEAGVERFVFSGVIYPFLRDMINHWAKNGVQEALVKSGMTYTILQPTNLMQSIGAFFWHKTLESGSYIEPWGQDKPLAWVDYRDVAEVAAMALLGDALNNGVFELSSTGTITRDGMVRLMSDALGREITTRTIPIEEWDGGNVSHDPAMHKAFLNFARFYDERGLPGGNDLVLRSLLGREPRTISSYINELSTQ
jgi:uncharacterized protein YbjT (DUF2867 family)